MDLEAQVMDLGKKVATLEADVENLVGWQKSQNGTIQGVADKVDRLQNWIMGLLGTTVLSLLGTVFLLLKK